MITTEEINIINIVWDLNFEDALELAEHDEINRYTILKHTSYRAPILSKIDEFKQNKYYDDFVNGVLCETDELFKINFLLTYEKDLVLYCFKDIRVLINTILDYYDRMEITFMQVSELFTKMLSIDMDLYSLHIVTESIKSLYEYDFIKDSKQLIL